MSKHILVVDDNETYRKVTRLFLESQLGLEVCGEAVERGRHRKKRKHCSLTLSFSGSSRPAEKHDAVTQSASINERVKAGGWTD
jgi:CheY-like chemotaxis protein